MDYEGMWKEMKSQFLLAKEELEFMGLEGSVSWQVANNTVDFIVNMESEYSKENSQKEEI